MIGRLLVLLVLMGGTFGSSSEELKGASGCADHEVLPGESKSITTFREEEGSVYLYPTDNQTKIHVTLHLTPFSRAQGHAFSLKDLCIDDLSKWYKITIRTSVDYVKVNEWAFVVSNEDCEKKMVTAYWHCCSSFDALSVVAIGSSLWRNEEPGPDCLPQSFSTTTINSGSLFLTRDLESISGPQEPSDDNGRLTKLIITISVVGCAIIIAITVFLVFLVRRRRRTPSGRGTDSADEVPPSPSTSSPPAVPPRPLRTMTGPPEALLNINGGGNIATGTTSSTAEEETYLRPEPPRARKKPRDPIYEHIPCNDPHCRMSTCFLKDQYEFVPVTVRIGDNFRA